MTRSIASYFVTLVVFVTGAASGDTLVDVIVGKAETNAEAKAKTAYDTAEKAAKAAEAALGPLRDDSKTTSAFQFGENL